MPTKLGGGKSHCEEYRILFGHNAQVGDIGFGKRRFVGMVFVDDDGNIMGATVTARRSLQARKSAISSASFKVAQT